MVGLCFGSSVDSRCGVVLCIGNTLLLSVQLVYYFCDLVSRVVVCWAVLLSKKPEILCSC
jgi:hypothetical protein